MSAVVTAIGFAAAIAAPLANASEAKLVNWPQPGLNAAHTGYNSKETAIGKANVGTLSLGWTFATQGAVQAEPVEQNGRLFVLSNDGTLYARSASTGAALWSYAAYPNGAGNSPGVSVAGNLVYTNCQVTPNFGGVCALEAATGKLVWSYALSGVNNTNAVTPPAVDGGLVFFALTAEVGGGHEGGFIALNAKTGSVAWSLGSCDASTTDPSCDNSQSGGAAPAVAGGGVFYGFGAYNPPPGIVGDFCRVDEKTGAKSWCTYTAGTNTEPAIGGGKVLFAVPNYDNSGTTLTALNETTGAVEWATKLSQEWNIYTAPAIAGSRAYFNVGGSLVAVSMAKGKVLWTYPSSGSAGPLYGGVSVANGIVFGECNGKVECAFDATTGAILSSEGDRYVVSGATPIVANGAVIEGCEYNSVCQYVP